MYIESTAIRDVLEYFGLQLSEKMIFGLDCTFGFSYYVKNSLFPPFYLDGKISKFPTALPKLLGIKVEKKSLENREKAWSEAKKLLDKGIPVPVFADMYYLDYLNIPKKP